VAPARGLALSEATQFYHDGGCAAPEFRQISGEKAKACGREEFQLAREGSLV
jgi:hypothetical protein